MVTLLYILHFIVCVGIIIIILLQADKGEGLSGAFGGGGAYAHFGSQHRLGFLGKLTTIIAALFMVTSLVLAIQAKHSAQQKILPVNAMPFKTPVKSKPVQKKAVQIPVKKIPGSKPKAK